MSEFGTVLSFERLLPGPIEGWAFITESGKRGRWLASELKSAGR
jgi:hypothetical protein